ncbi:SGNH/GDSL hydrolase family protein [Rhodococcus gordoniae]|uniref:SGNH/GDSL hydrolase family protein n=1 Tax=Rhodococcus gordoniae TaxID=223392 RepID=UPI003525866D
MTRIIGTVVDIAGRATDGILTVSAPALRHSADGKVVDRVRVDIGISGGVIATNTLDPGPAKLVLDTRGGWQEFEVVIPDVPEIDLYTLVEQYVRYDPPVVGAAQKALADALAAAKRAEDAAASADLLPDGGTDGQILAKSGTGLAWIDPPTGGGSISDGPLAIASATYRSTALAAKAGTGRLRMVTIADSTGDGYAGGQAGAPTSWSQTWPVSVGAALRTGLGITPGGRGWVGPATPLAEANYAYTVADRAPAGYGRDDLAGQIGIPGSLWLQDGHASNVDKVTWTLDPAVTSVDLVLAAYGNALTVTTATRGAQTITPSGDPVTVRIADPGVSLSIENGTASGFAVLGMVEYRGDETAGVTTWNLSQASTTAATWATWLSGADMTLSPVLAGFAPQVALVCLGSNDFGTGRTSAQLRASLASVHASLRAASPGVVVVFVVRDLPDTGWDAFADAIVAEAAVLGAHALDLRAVVPASTAGAYLADEVHLTVAGNDRFADAVADFMRVGSASGGGGSVAVTETEPGSGLFTITSGGAPALVETEPGSGLYTIGG